MKLKTLALAAVALVWGYVGTAVPAGADDKDDAAKAAKALDGTWQVVSQWTDGNEDVIAKDGGDVVVISGGKYTVRQGEKEVATGTFTVDAGKSPMTIDKQITDGDSKGKTAVGIYEVKGEEAKMAWAKPGETDRPTEFTGKSHRMMTLKRIKS
jgi:uncharacterized protein (TIGR03067 family)